jgi:uncharacterized membrane protein YqhA
MTLETGLMLALALLLYRGLMAVVVEINKQMKEMDEED